MASASVGLASQSGVEGEWKWDKKKSITSLRSVPAGVARRGEIGQKAKGGAADAGAICVTCLSGRLFIHSENETECSSAKSESVHTKKYVGLG